MSAITNYLEEAWLNMLKGTAYTAPAAVYVKLHVSDPGETPTSHTGGSASSVTSRQQVTFGTVSQDGSSPTKATVSNTNDISWTNWAGTNGEVVTHISLWDAQTTNTGNPLWYGALTASKTVNTGDTLTIPANSLTLTLA